MKNWDVFSHCEILTVKVKFNSQISAKFRKFLITQNLDSLSSIFPPQTTERFVIGIFKVYIQNTNKKFKETLNIILKDTVKTHKFFRSVSNPLLYRTTNKEAHKTKQYYIK